ncbi:MAG: hypothetical protein KQ78_01270 [Candidatus Izimaplasma bacterium HR2]|nr:MAG: hypothetical protein KQ78_01270 [Candidatus Izimaplasma bacterium HR2]
MHPITLYTSFIHSIIHGGHPEEIDRLRIMVQETIGIYNKIPDKNLVDIFRHKLFSEKIIIPPDRVENYEEIMIDMFGEDYEDFFKI